MQESYISNNKIKENKYKILRMSLILGSDENREETLNNFEESAREIDAMNDETYLTEIEGKFYDTLKLEEEEQKLAILVDYIGGRVEQRISLLSDFANITGYDLSNLPPIKYYDKLDDYKERLKYIREYLSNTKQINKLDEEIDESERKLKEAYVNKATSEEYNARNEEILLSKFENIIKPLAEFQDVTIENVDSKINDVISGVEESKKSLDIFTKSYNTLKGSGISYEEETEYKSYVDNAEDIYYGNKEQEYLLRIYKLLFTKETTYNQIILKRESINQILAERMNLRAELEINSSDILNPLYDMLERQLREIESQKDNIDSIEYLTKLIETAREERDVLEQANQKVEILSLLREFCMIDTYTELEESTSNEIEELAISEMEESTLNEATEANNSEENLSNTTIETETNSIPENLFIPNTEENDTQQEETKEESVRDNQVIVIEPVNNLDLDLIRSKAEKVMKRVGEMLGIKVDETTIVSITNNNEQKKAEEPIETNSTTPSGNETLKPEPILPENPLPSENPLFNNNINDTTVEQPVDPEDDNNFWFPSDTPDALNDLPDLEVSNNNFFGNNEIPELNFPDLKLDFGTNDTEGQ